MNYSMSGTGSAKLEQPVSKTSDNVRTILLTQHNSEYNTEEQWNPITLLELHQKCWLDCYRCLLQLLVSTGHIACMYQHCTKALTAAEETLFTLYRHSRRGKGVHTVHIYCRLPCYSTHTFCVFAKTSNTTHRWLSSCGYKRGLKTLDTNIWNRKSIIGAKLFHDKLWSSAIWKFTNFKQKCTVQSRDIDTS